MTLTAPLPTSLPETTLYPLGRSKGANSLWAELTPSGGGLRPTWQLAVAARSRGGAKVAAPLLETGVLRPLATVTLKGESYPLTIDRHALGRGGRLEFGGERKLGTDGVTLAWEMRWLPVAGEDGLFRVEMRLRTTPRRLGALTVSLALPLHRPEVWALPAAGGAAWSAWSAYSGHAVQLVAPEAEAGWSGADGAPSGGFRLDWAPFSLGGGRLISFGLGFGPAKTAADARAHLVRRFVALSPARLPLESVPSLDPARTVARLTASDAYDTQGMERLYLKSPLPGGAGWDEGSHCGAGPHEPAGALKALWDWNRLHAAPDIPRLVRFGARGLCADFQVMGRSDSLGRGEEPEPNKGAFWDKKTFGVGTDWADGATHGLAANARLARHLFLLHRATEEPLLRQSALNIGHWLLLKQSERGFYDGARVQGTRGLPGDGRVLPQPCALDGAEAIRAFVPAYYATRNEVWIKAAWKVADFLLQARRAEFEDQSPAAVAAVILALLALDGESPNASLRGALAEWGAWLRALPLPADLPSLSPDGLSAGRYDCADAGFGLFGLTRDPAWLRYALAALAGVPPESPAWSWRAIAAHQSALLSLAGLLPGSKLDFDAPSVTLDWRVFAPDPAAAPFLRVQAAGGEAASVDWLPLVCRGTDQLLLLFLAPPTVSAVSVWKNGKRPLLRDLRTGLVDSDAPLAPLGKERWANIGLFTIDP